MSAATTFLGRLAGIERIEAQLEAQNQATADHRAWEGEKLRAIEATGEETKALAVRTNGRVNEHDVQLALIKRDEERAADLEAARIKAEGDVSSAKRSWQQTALMVGGGAVGGTVSLVVGYLVVHLVETGHL